MTIALCRGVAAFAAFDEEIPDPQDPMTFQQSKLTRRGEPAGLRTLYRDALALRPRLRADGPEATARADGRRLTVTRGPYRILANFGDEPWPLDGEPLLVAGDVRDGALHRLAGAVVR